MLTVEHRPSPPESFLSNEVEGYAYYTAFQESGIENFGGASDENGFIRLDRHSYATAQSEGASLAIPAGSKS